MSYQHGQTNHLDVEGLKILRSKIAHTRAQSEAHLELLREESRLQRIHQQVQERKKHFEAERIKRWATDFYGYKPEECANRLKAAVSEIYPKVVQSETTR